MKDKSSYMHTQLRLLKIVKLKDPTLKKVDTWKIKVKYFKLIEHSLRINAVFIPRVILMSTMILFGQ